MSRGEPFDFNSADDDDDRPRRRRGRDADDEDDDRPSRSRRRRGDDLEDDYRDGPRRRGQGDGLGKAAMITGIASLAITLITGLLSCLCVFGVIGVGLGVIGGIVAIILGFVARSKTPGSGPGLTG